MNWFLIALIAPLFWTFSNHTDKYVLSKYFKDGSSSVIVMFIAFLDILFIPFAFLFNHNVLSYSLVSILILGLFGALGVLAYIFYYNALSEEDASVVVPLYQLVPVFAFFIAYLFLQETLSIRQIVASLTIVIGSIIISLDITNRIPKIKGKVLGFMAIACLEAALGSVAFKYIAVQDDFWGSAFWTYVGSGVSGVGLFIFVKSYRDAFLAIFRVNKLGLISLIGLSEIFNILANLAQKFALLFAPVTLVLVVNGFQPFFVLLIGIVLTLFFPLKFNESLLKKHLIQKIGAIIIIFIGTYFLNV
jgi:drug/metabolite transporter (DMT)-like permease